MNMNITKNKHHLTYESKSIEIVMPESSEIKIIVLNKLKGKTKDLKTPVTKLQMPTQKGFFRGVDYEEDNILLGYSDNTWEKLTSIKFGDDAESVIGTKKIEKVASLSELDKKLKNKILKTVK